MKQTGAYQLNQWELTDRIRMEDFNSDNTKVDAALAALRDGKAEASALNTLSGRVDAKAEQSALNALSNRVDAKAEQAALNNLENWVNSKDHYVKLVDMTLTEAASSVNVPLTGIDWNAWQKVVIHSVLNHSGYCRIRCNDDSGCTCVNMLSRTSDGGYVAVPQEGEPRVTCELICSRRSDLRVRAEVYTETGRFYTHFSGLTIAGLSDMNYLSYTLDPFGVGSHFEVWGVR